MLRPLCTGRRVALLKVVAWLLCGSLAAENEHQGGAAVQSEPASDGISLAMLNAQYLHFNYGFEFGKDRGFRQGRGEMRLWKKDDGHTYIYQRAETKSGAVGNTQITMLAHPSDRRLYTKFDVESLHEHQCLWYLFPNASAYPQRVKLLRKRMKAVSEWPEKGPLEVQWTKSNVLELQILDSVGVSSAAWKSHVRLKRGKETVKTFTLLGNVEYGSEPPADARSLFEPPSDSCQESRKVVGPVATVQLQPPHERSSALNDLLLALTMQGTSKEFLTLSSMALPGDTALMIEDPKPPNIANFGGFSFDYAATVYRRQKEHKSNGTLWLDVNDRAFRIYGQAMHSVLGRLDLNVIAQQNPKPVVYAALSLTSQAKQQCLMYDYPKKPPDGIQKLAAATGFKFLYVADLDDEDCAVFQANLARGRRLHIWVDMEKDDFHAILRVEVYHNEELLRRAEIFNWMKVKDRPDTEPFPLQPDPNWKCQNQSEAEKDHDGTLAEFGIASAQNMHKRSLELLDALYALRKLPPADSLLELLALPGDVAMVVSEPDLPELWTLPGLVFNYTLTMPFIPASVHLGGYFAANFQKGLFRMTAGAVGNERLDLAISPTSIDVQITPVADLGNCPNMGLRALDRCWYLSEGMQSCRNTCEEQGLAFEWTVVPPGESMLPVLLGRQPRQKQGAWGRLECYEKGEDSYHPAQPVADPSTRDNGDPGDWRYAGCQLACPCSPMVPVKETKCLSVSVPAKKESVSLSHATLWNFDKVGSINETVTNIFSFPVPGERSERYGSQEAVLEGGGRRGDELLETSVSLWYSEEDSAAHRITLDRETETVAQIDITGWKALTKVPPMDLLKTPASWNCRIRELDFHPWLELANSRQNARLIWEHCQESECPLPASAALWQMAEAAGVMGLLSPEAQDKISRLVAWTPSRPSASQIPHRPLVDMFSDNLEAFSFSFASMFPTGSLATSRNHGVGEIRVDLKNRRLSMRSEAHNVSKGVPLVESHIIYRGDHKTEEGKLEPLLLLHTQIGPHYQQCWTVKGAEGSTPPGPQPNPFGRAKLVESRVSAPTMHNGKHDVTSADKYHYAMTAVKNVDLFVDEQKKLIALDLHDLHRHTTSGVIISDWLTDPIEEKWFERQPEWDCADTRYPQNLEDKLAEWDLLSFFFPQEEKPKPISPGIDLSGDDVADSPPQRHRRMEAEEVQQV